MGYTPYGKDPPADWVPLVLAVLGAVALVCCCLWVLRLAGV